tara:strand:- start:11779 stop:12372 length:594 start_codon:yes stop_codon:yes gene_type:complete
MNIFGVVIVDMWTDSPRAGSHPIFTEHLIKEINKLSPTAVIVDSESGEETYNQSLVDRLNCPIKSFIRNPSEWMTSGLLIGNWLWVGATWQICVHMNQLGLLNMFGIKKQYPSTYGKLFNILVRPDLILKDPDGGIDDLPAGYLSELELLEDYHFEWDQIGTGYYSPIQKKQDCPEGNPWTGSYDMNINRSNDKRLT